MGCNAYNTSVAQFWTAHIATELVTSTTIKLVISTTIKLVISTIINQLVTNSIVTIVTKLVTSFIKTKLVTSTIATKLVTSTTTKLVISTIISQLVTSFSATELVTSSLVAILVTSSIVTDLVTCYQFVLFVFLYCYPHYCPAAVEDPGEHRGHGTPGPDQPPKIVLKMTILHTFLKNVQPHFAWDEKYLKYLKLHILHNYHKKCPLNVGTMLQGMYPVRRTVVSTKISV